MRLKTLYILLILVCLRGSITAQMEGDQWVLGYWGGDPAHSIMFIDFRNAKFELTAHPHIKMWMRGCASNVCSANGAPLLWTNGMQIMGNDGKYVADTIAYDGEGLYWIGFTLPGHLPIGLPEPDNAIILPVPGHEDEYSIIYHFNEEHPTFIYATSQYLEARVRMTEKGEFELKFKDVPVGPRREWFNGTISSVRHANGRDWWLVTFVEDSPEYYLYLLDPTGIHLYRIGILDMPIKEGLGQSTFSNSGNYFARMDAISTDSGQYITLFQFDRCVGELVRKNTFHTTNGVFTGVAFSLSEQYLYANSSNQLWQWDLEAQNIEQSQILVDTFDGFIEPDWFVVRFGPMRMAPDGKIYIIPRSGSSKYMHVIERPDLSAPQCKFLQHEIDLGIWNGRTVPNIPNYRLGPIDGGYCDTLGINNLPISRWRYENEIPEDPLVIHFTDLTFFDPQSWHWDFGDGHISNVSSPIHTFEPGYYYVCQTVSNPFAMDSSCQWIAVLPTGIQEDLEKNVPDISVSPNPFNSFINVQSSKGNFRNAHLQVYDMHGRLVSDYLDIAIPSKIYLPNYSPGIYLVTLIEENKTPVSFKLMKN